MKYSLGLSWLDERSVANNVHAVERGIRLYAKEGKCRFINLSKIEHEFHSKWLGNASYLVLYCAALWKRESTFLSSIVVKESLIQ